jgi:hypothetical protein
MLTPTIFTITGGAFTGRDELPHAMDVVNVYVLLLVGFAVVPSAASKTLVKRLIVTARNKTEHRNTAVVFLPC